MKYKMLALTVVMAFGLAACSRDGDGNPGAGATLPPATNAPDEIDEIGVDNIGTGPDLISQTPIKDMGGRNFKWLCYYDLNPAGWAKADPPPTMENSDNYEIEMMQWNNAQRVYNDYNADVTNVTVGWDEVVEVLTTSVMAGAPEGDLVRLDKAWILNPILNNIIIPFDDFMPADHDLFTTKVHAFPTSQLVGKTWTAEKRILAVDDAAFLGVNLDIIRSIGAENPAELYDRGEWTIEKFLEISRAATRATTSSGVIDQYGVGGQPNDILLGFMAANDGSTITEDLQYGFAHPYSMRAIDTAYTIFNTDKSWNYDPSSGAKFDDWHRNTYNYKDGNVCFFNAWIWSLPLLEERTFDYTAVPYPKGPDNTGETTYFSSFLTGVGIPRGVENPEDVFTIYYELNKWYGDDFDLADEQALNYPYERLSNVRDAHRIVDAIAVGRKFDLGEAINVDGIGYNWVANAACEAFYYDTHTPAQIIEENRQLREEMIEQVLGALR